MDPSISMEAVSPTHAPQISPQVNSNGTCPTVVLETQPLAIVMADTNLSVPLSQHNSTDSDGFTTVARKKGRAKAWNIRGLNSPLKQKEVLNLVFSQHISLFAILETKLSSNSLEVFQNNLSSLGTWNLRNNFDISPHGRILVGWDSSVIHSCQVVSSSHQYMHCCVIISSQKFFVTFIYAFNQLLSRASLWSDLCNISYAMVDPWTLLGDFNCLLNIQDKLGSNVFLRDTIELSQFYNACNIFDVPYTGFRFTWSNKREELDRTLCKLDRVACNEAWIRSFPSSHAIFTAPGVSDHSPAILKLPHIKIQTPTKRRFKFCNAWTLNENFMRTVEESWHSSGPCLDLFHVHLKLKALKKCLLSAFAKSTTNISDRVKQAREQLHHIQDQLCNHPSNTQLQLTSGAESLGVIGSADPPSPT
uniref:Endonuclease/exonuclease/phosphatase domain-containing protein n=1 Tax=Kalanchoe fedtschenkoi TaxID=63787 RepID=A0A7N0VD32_KALFE